MQDFVASDPILSEFKAEILKYQNVEQEIENIETTFRVGHGAIEMFSGERCLQRTQIRCSKTR